MNTVGQILSDGRNSKNLSIRDISIELNISKSIIIDLENDNIINNPDIIFNIGHLRSYSNFLELDTDTIIEKFKLQVSFDIKEEKTRMFAVYIGKWEFDQVFEFKKPREYGDKITEARRKELLLLLGDFSSNSNTPSSSMVPEDADPLVPMVDDFEVLEENERQFWEEE